MKTIYTLLLFSVFTISLSAQCDNSWLNITQGRSCVDLGNLVVSGNQLTVEATFSRNVVTTPIGTISIDLVAKHSHGYDAGNVNYLLRVDHAEMNAGGRFYGTSYVPCLENTLINTTYHVAMVYNGSTLTFYRDGLILSQTPASGNMATDNTVPARIGSEHLVSSVFDPTLIGYINNVRIWNKALSQEELQLNIYNDDNAILIDPIPANLLGYYNFGNVPSSNGSSGLMNRAGSNYNGFIGTVLNAITMPVSPAPAVIAVANPYCNVLDICGPVPLALTAFDAAVSNNRNIKLTWYTEQENGVAKYIIQRAEGNSGIFTSIGTVEANDISGNNHYSFTDINVKANIIYKYRLAIQERSGQQTYSSIRSSKITHNNFSISVSENPTRGVFNVKANAYTGNANIKIVNSVGQVLSEQKINAINTNGVRFDISSQPKGNYWIIVQTESDRIVKNIVKL